MKQKELLTIRNLHVSAGDKEILHGVNLTVGSDETHVLMGPNGTGKSTLGYAITGNPAYHRDRRRNSLRRREHHGPARQRAREARVSSSRSRTRWRCRA